MNAPFALLVLMSALLQTPATGVRISGRVVDGETGKPLADAIVTLSSRTANDSKVSTPVRANGTFEFANIPRGSYVLRAEHSKPLIPYRSESLDLDITNRNLEDVGMILSPAMPKIAVTGKVVLSGGGALPSAVSTFTLSTDAIPIQRDGSFEMRMRPMEKYEVRVPSGYYVEAISAGQWNSTFGLWTLRDKPTSPVQITLRSGQQRISGRVLAANKTPASQAIVTLVGPAPATTARPVTISDGATFSITGIRPGDYELRAQTGSGEAMQSAMLQFTLGTQSREGIELVLKGLTAIKGQVLVSGRTLEELIRFKPVIDVEDTTGTRRIAIDSKGNFDFKSFEGAFTVAVRELPIEFRVQSVTMGPASVTVRIGAYVGDSPDFFRFNRGPIPIK